MLGKHIDKEGEFEAQRMAEGVELNTGRYETMLRDRHKLTHNIEALDGEREKTLQCSCEAVNAHFTPMASFLLPAVRARLELVEMRGWAGSPCERASAARS